MAVQRRLAGGKAIDAQGNSLES